MSVSADYLGAEFSANNFIELISALRVNESGKWVSAVLLACYMPTYFSLGISYQGLTMPVIFCLLVIDPFL